MWKSVLAAASIAVLALPGLSLGAGQTARRDRIVGVEIPPVSTRLGTFVGIATGGLPGSWRVQIRHDPLSTGRSVAITGGTLTLRTGAARRLGGTVIGGSVSVVDGGARCTNQLYAVDARTTLGRFTGTLTHHRRLIFGRCLVYGATLSGSATFAV